VARVAAVAIPLAVVAALLSVVVYRAVTPDAAAVRAAADAAAVELRGTPVHGLGIYLLDVQDALHRGAGGTAGRLRLAGAGQDERGDLYEITNNRGDHPVCLAVLVDINLFTDAPSFPTVAVSDGAC
jgi:hypothetical protein